MSKRYNVIVTTNDAKSIRHEEIVTKEAIKQRLAEIISECNIDWERVFNDDRCKYFLHYMPANVTTTKHSYEKNNILHKSGNIVRVYISER